MIQPFNTFFRNIIEFNTDSKEPAYLVKREKLTNYLTLIGSSVYLFYGFIFIVLRYPFDALLNFGVCIVLFGGYFVLSYYQKVKLARFFLFYLLPILGFLPFTFRYGNIGAEYYTFALLIMFIFLEDKRSHHYLYLAFCILLFFGSKFIIASHPVAPHLQSLAEKCYVPNIIFSFLLSASFILLFKKEISHKHQKITNVSKQLEQKYLEERNRLEQIEFLSNELNHRVKNNLQIITSIINIQLSQYTTPESYQALINIRNKILSMSLIHQKLIKTEKGYLVSLDNYLNNLIDNILDNINKEFSIRKRVRLEPIKIHMEDAVHMGLIVNELITNSIKHANNNNHAVSLKVDLARKDDIIILKVKDNGSGFPPNYDLEKSNSFGLTFIYQLVQSYRGHMSIQNKNGAEVTIDLILKTQEENAIT